MQVAEDANPDSDELSWTTITVLCLLGEDEKTASSTTSIKLLINNSTFPAGAFVIGAFIKFIVDLIRDLGPRERYNGPEITFPKDNSKIEDKLVKEADTTPVM